MKLAIISDSHDNLVNIEKFLSWSRKNKIEVIIHCGDIASGETITKLAHGFVGKIYLVYGNMDESYRDEIYETIDTLNNVELFGDVGEVSLDNKKIACCHFPERARTLAESGKYDLVFYGHTHKPWEEKIGYCRLVNPGTLAGLFYKATFAVYDTVSGRLELKVLGSHW